MKNVQLVFHGILSRKHYLIVQIDIEIWGFSAENVKLLEVYRHISTWHFAFVNERTHVQKREPLYPNFCISKLKAEIKYPHCKWVQVQIRRACYGVFQYHFLLVGVCPCLKMMVFFWVPKCKTYIVKTYLRH